MVLFTHFVSANQQLGFSVSGTPNVNTQSVHKTPKLIIAEIHPIIQYYPEKDQARSF